MLFPQLVYSFLLSYNPKASWHKLGQATGSVEGLGMYDREQRRRSEMAFYCKFYSFCRGKNI